MYKLFKKRNESSSNNKKRSRGNRRSQNADPYGILSRPFPPLASRAKSPSDLLDFVGYPRLTLSSPDLTQIHSVSPRPPPHQQRRPPVGPRRASFHHPHVSLPPAVSPPKAHEMLLHWEDKTEVPDRHTPPALLHPAPTAIAASAADAEDDAAKKDAKQDDDVVCLASAKHELSVLRKQIWLYRQEQEMRLQREEEHRQREEWMHRKLQETLAQLEQLRLSHQVQKEHAQRKQKSNVERKDHVAASNHNNDDDEAYYESSSSAEQPTQPQRRRSRSNARGWRYKSENDHLDRDQLEEPGDDRSVSVSASEDGDADDDEEDDDEEEGEEEAVYWYPHRPYRRTYSSDYRPLPRWQYPLGRSSSHMSRRNSISHRPPPSVEEAMMMRQRMYMMQSMMPYYGTSY
ncbi:hypothetical protein BCR43DRAFT_492788 [Syncephalastrum racemosum]|uniref:Uncharacterized protein n=1 Tax=Syncephalastrum racemosum TaxID=13706 RepID=A0A1X2H9G5_SYNRA|nr:hypothetical protein BCR43DRAFT_492788 [Syncephalastrum racemosum]